MFMNLREHFMTTDSSIRLSALEVIKSKGKYNGCCFNLNVD